MSRGGEHEEESELLQPLRIGEEPVKMFFLLIEEPNFDDGEMQSVSNELVFRFFGVDSCRTFIRLLWVRVENRNER